MLDDHERAILEECHLGTTKSHQQVYQVFSNTEKERRVHILDNMKMIRSEYQSSTVLQVDLHTDQACDLVLACTFESFFHAYGPSVCPGRWCNVMP